MACEKSRPDSVIQRARELHQRGFTKAAIDILEVELQGRPNEGILWHLRATLLYGLGRFVEALADIEQAMMLIPLDSRGHLLLADCHRKLGHQEMAIHTYTELANHRAGMSEEDLLRLLRGLAATGCWKQAAQVCRQEVEVHPDDDRMLFCLAQSLVRLSQPADTVLPLLRRAIQLAPAVCRYRVVLVLQLIKHNRTREAYQELTNITAMDIDSICCRGCLHRLLQLALAHGDADRAETFARQLAGMTGQSGHTEEDLP